MFSYFHDYKARVEKKLDEITFGEIFRADFGLCILIRDRGEDNYYIERNAGIHGMMWYDYQSDLPQYELAPLELFGKQMFRMKFESAPDLTELINVVFWDNDFKAVDESVYYAYIDKFNLDEKFRLNAFIPDPQAELPSIYSPQKLIKLTHFIGSDSYIDIYLDTEKSIFSVFDSQSYDSEVQTFWEYDTYYEATQKFNR